MTERLRVLELSSSSKHDSIIPVAVTRLCAPGVFSEKSPMTFCCAWQDDDFSSRPAHAIELFPNGMLTAGQFTRDMFVRSSRTAPCLATLRGDETWPPHRTSSTRRCPPAVENAWRLAGLLLSMAAWPASGPPERSPASTCAVAARPRTGRQGGRRAQPGLRRIHPAGLGTAAVAGRSAMRASIWPASTSATPLLTASTPGPHFRIAARRRPHYRRRFGAARGGNRLAARCRCEIRPSAMPALPRWQRSPICSRSTLPARKSTTRPCNGSPP